MNHNTEHSRFLELSTEEGYCPIVNTRRHPRFDTVVKVRLHGRQVRVCRGNVSAYGFCFEWSEQMGVGAWVELSVRLPGTGEWVHVWGRVLGCHQRGDGTFVRGWFARIRSGHKACFKRWVETRQPLNLAA